MRITIRMILFSTAAAFLALTAGEVFAEENTVASGEINALDANQGSGVQTNADDWENISAALAGDGTQNSEIDGDANTGSGTQDNSESFSDYWENIGNGNTGSGAQVLDSTNSNGGDRISDDAVFDASDGAIVANAALAATVSGNSVAAGGASSAADSSLSIAGDSGFVGASGVTAVAIGSGASASQNVGVNVTATVNGGS